MGVDSDRDGRDRHYREERRSVSDDYGRPANDAYAGDTDSYYSFSDTPSARSSQYGGHDDHVGYSHSKREWVDELFPVLQYTCISLCLK